MIRKLGLKLLGDFECNLKSHFLKINLSCHHDRASLTLQDEAVAVGGEDALDRRLGLQQLAVQLFPAVIKRIKLFPGL